MGQQRHERPSASAAREGDIVIVDANDDDRTQVISREAVGVPEPVSSNPDTSRQSTLLPNNAPKSTLSSIADFLWDNRKKILLTLVFLSAAVLLFLFPPAFLAPLTSIIGMSILKTSAIWAKAIMVLAGSVGTFLASGMLMKGGQWFYNWVTDKASDIAPVNQGLEQPKSRWERFKGFVKDHPVLTISLVLGAAMAIGLSVALFAYSGGTASIVLPAVFMAIKKGIIALMPLVVGVTIALTGAAAITTVSGLAVGLVDTALQLDDAEQEKARLQQQLNDKVMLHVARALTTSSSDDTSVLRDELDLDEPDTTKRTTQAFRMALRKSVTENNAKLQELEDELKVQKDTVAVKNSQIKQISDKLKEREQMISHLRTQLGMLSGTPASPFGGTANDGVAAASEDLLQNLLRRPQPEPQPQRRAESPVSVSGTPGTMFGGTGAAAASASAPHHDTETLLSKFM